MILEYSCSKTIEYARQILSLKLSYIIRHRQVFMDFAFFWIVLTLALINLKPFQRTFYDNRWPVPAHAEHIYIYIFQLEFTDARMYQH